MHDGIFHIQQDRGKLAERGSHVGLHFSIRFRNSSKSFLDTRNPRLRMSATAAIGSAMSPRRNASSKTPSAPATGTPPPRRLVPPDTLIDHQQVCLHLDCKLNCRSLAWIKQF